MTITCFSCGESCTGEVLKVKDRHFHVSCFTCKECGQQLASGGYFMKNDEYFCSKDYHIKFGTKCQTCGDYVEGRVVTALGHSYHPRCFTCDRCKSEIHSGTVVTYNDRQEILCQKCTDLALCKKTLEAEKKSQILAAAKKGTVLVNSRNILITGPGGAGKTCLVRIMSGEEPLDIYDSTGVFDEARRVASLTMICQTPSDKKALLKKKFTLLKGDALLKFMACGTRSRKSEAGHDNTAATSGPSNSNQPTNFEVFNEPLDSENSNQQPDSEVATDPETNATIEGFLSDVAEYLENHPTDPIAEVDLFYIIDSGGQLQFHEVLHKFVSKVHCTVYVTNVNDQPTDQVLDQFYVDGKAEGEPYLSHYTHEQLFKRSLQALQLQTSVGQKPASTETAASDKKSTQLSVVATHIDEMKIEDAIKKKHKWVVDIAKAAGVNDKDIVYPGSSVEEPVYALDASNLSKSQESVNEFLETLRTEVSCEKELIPLGRFILEEMMRKAAEESSGIVSIAKCCEIGRCVAMSSKSVEEELCVLNDHNRILYMPDVSKEIIFCDVQTPLSVLKQLAQYSALARNDSELRSANISKRTIKDPVSLLKLLKEGTLTEEVLVKHAASFFKHGFTPQIFLELMEKCQIIAKQCSQDKTAKDQEKVLKDQAQSAQANYFMPCILREAPGRVLEARRNSDVEPLLLYFGEWPEAGKFCTLVTQLVSQKQWQPRPFLKEKYLYRNCITFYVKEHSCSITLIELYSCGYFEVHICLPSGEPPERLSEICPQIRQTLYDVMSADIKPKDAFICSMSTCEHKIIIEENHQTAEEEYLKNEKECDAEIARIRLKQEQESIEDAEELTDLESQLNDAEDAKTKERMRYETEVAMIEESQQHAAVFEEDNLLRCTKDEIKTQRLKEDDQRYVWCPEKMCSMKQDQQRNKDAKKRRDLEVKQQSTEKGIVNLDEQKRHAAEEAKQMEEAAAIAKLEERKRHAEEARRKQWRHNWLRHVVYGLLLCMLLGGVWGVVLWYTTERVCPSSRLSTMDVHIEMGPLADARPSPSELLVVRWSGAGGRVEEFRLKDHIIGSCKELGSVLGLTAALTQSLCPDPDSCCDNVLLRWAQGAIDNRTSYPYTWRGLVEALQAANLHQPARDLAQALNNRATDS